MEISRVYKKTQLQKEKYKTMAKLRFALISNYKYQLEAIRQRLYFSEKMGLVLKYLDLNNHQLYKNQEVRQH